MDKVKEEKDLGTKCFQAKDFKKAIEELKDKAVLNNETNIDKNSIVHTHLFKAGAISVKNSEQPIKFQERLPRLGARI